MSSRPADARVTLEPSAQAEIASASPADPHVAVRRWLWLVYLFVLAMVVLGGITRLTGSGLSMVAWEPHRILPPIGEAAWEAELARYQASPQFQLVNSWMTLADFKRIFFWEYVHRLVGRLAGVVFLAPLVYFALRRRLRGRLLGATLVLFAFGALQGLVGWLMVASGLVDRPEVSHLRLAAHLVLAFGLGHAVLWLLLSLRPSIAPARGPTATLRWMTWLTLGVLIAQIAWGAFMAGTRAGLVASTFPDMHGHYLPGGLLREGASLVHDPVAIHYVHRVLGFVLVPLLLGLIACVWREPRARRSAIGASVALLAQIALGAATVIWLVPISLAVLHQAFGFGVLSHVVAFAVRSGALPRLRVG